MVRFSTLLWQAIGATIGGLIGSGLAFWISGWLGETIGFAVGEGVVILGFASTLPGVVMGAGLATWGVAHWQDREGLFWLALVGAVAGVAVYMAGGSAPFQAIRSFGLLSDWFGLALLSGIGAMVGFNLPNFARRE